MGSYFLPEPLLSHFKEGFVSPSSFSMFLHSLVQALLFCTNVKDREKYACTVFWPYSKILEIQKMKLILCP